MSRNKPHFSVFLFFILSFCAAGCATLPEVKHQHYSFPERNVFIELPTGELQNRKFDVLGWVRSRADFPTMDMEHSDEGYCKNYYNKAANQLLKEAKKAGADAVIKVRSVVLLLDGKVEEHPTPECSDDGAEGQIMLKGVAIKFKPLEVPPGPEKKTN